MTEAGASRLVTIVANAVAAAFGLSTVRLLGLGPWLILAAPLAGTIGWFVGWAGGRWASRHLSRLGYAEPGRPGYRLRELPPDEVTAGGKATALARATRAGLPTPEGFVLLPRAFEGDRPTAPATALLERQLRRFPAGQRFAIRSSALGEDAAGASFAGAFESVLDIAAEGVPDAIATVRASGRSRRVEAYGQATGTQPGDLAVLVQPMVPAELAGVLFTVDPLTGDLSTMLGNIVAGLGESLVSGAETGEQFTLARPSGRLAGAPPLDPFAARLHDLAHRAEGAFGGVPQDIEWAIAGGRVWLLQARPITTLNPWNPRTAERNDSLAGTCLWSATNLSEANPRSQTPLTASLTAYQQANGGPSMALRGREMAGSIGGRPYANLTVQITARRGKAAKADPREVYRRLAGWWGELPESVPMPLLPMTADDWSRAGLPMLGALARMAWTRRRLPTFLRGHEARCAEISDAVAACSRPAELRRLWDGVLFDFSLQSFWAVIASGSEYPARLEAELRDQFGPTEAAALTSNASGLAGGLESLGPAAGLQEVLAGRLSRADYLARFGHRGENEGELAWPRPAEDPAWLDRLLAGAGAGVDVDRLRRQQQDAYGAALARIGVQDPGLAKRIERKLRRAAQQAALREAVRSEGVRTTWVGRRFALRAGELLGIGEDVFLLTIEELLAALDGDTAPFALLDLRRETHRRYRELPPLPGVIVGRFDPFAWAADPDRRTDVYVAGAEPAPAASGLDMDVVTGHAAGTGRVEGVVRRLDRLEDAAHLQPGEVLVTQLTNIGWTPLFPRAGGIVTDLGAPLSHAAIVARELGIPAVVGCGDATARLHTGDRVVVDAAAGRVLVLARAPIEETDADVGSGRPSQPPGSSAHRQVPAVLRSVEVPPPASKGSRTLPPRPPRG